MSTLPADIIEDILSRLPVKTLLRFRCVSKPWCFLIDSPNFVKLHLNQSIRHNTNLSLIFRSFHLCSADFDTLDNPVELNNHPFKSTDFNTKILSSCNGLLCLYSGDNPNSSWNLSRKHYLFDRKYTISLWNPSTRKHQMIPFLPISPPPDILTRFSRFGFGYDSVNDDYKLVRIVQFKGCKFDAYYSEVSVYNLKTNSWRRIRDCPYYLHAKQEFGVHVNGALHWVMNRKRESETKNLDYLVVAFDLACEEFVEVPQPEYLDKSFVMNLGVLGGCLCILCNYNRVLIDIWVMKEYGVKESWTKLFSISEQEIGRRFVNLRPLAYSKNGKEVLLEQDRRKMIWYDLEKKSVRNALIRGTRYCMGANICLGSLVQLNGGSGIDGKKKEAGEKKEENNKKRKSIGVSV